jgi:hypothetical protein
MVGYEWVGMKEGFKRSLTFYMVKRKRRSDVRQLSKDSNVRG